MKQEIPGYNKLSTNIQSLHTNNYFHIHQNHIYTNIIFSASVAKTVYEN
jgi:hypothetical protein